MDEVRETKASGDEIDIERKQWQPKDVPLDACLFQGQTAKKVSTRLSHRFRLIRPRFLYFLPIV